MLTFDAGTLALHWGYFFTGTVIPMLATGTGHSNADRIHLVHVLEQLAQAGEALALLSAKSLSWVIRSWPAKHADI